MRLKGRWADNEGGESLRPFLCLTFDGPRRTLKMFSAYRPPQFVFSLDDVDSSFASGNNQPQHYQPNINILIDNCL